MDVTWLPSSFRSSTPVTVTSCGVSQLPLLNWSSVSLTVISPVSPFDRSRRTTPAGWAVSTTVKVSLLPASVTEVPPSDSTIVNPAPSLSTVVTLTDWSATASQSSSDEPSTTLRETVVFWSPSSSRSSTPVTVTVCGSSQVLEVKVRVA